ncbi:MAG: hypothetical protein HOE12_11045 [Gammaproteobacteria bacterium]|nr:hypothetical protein [Gammaproteobacteria bacterium]
MMNFIQSLITQSLQPARKSAGRNFPTEVTNHQSTPTEVIPNNHSPSVQTKNLNNTIRNPNALQTATDQSVDGPSLIPSSSFNTTEQLQESNSIQQQEVTHLSEPTNPAIGPITKAETLSEVSKPLSGDTQSQFTEKLSDFNKRSATSTIENTTASQNSNLQTVIQHDGPNEISLANQSTSRVSTQHKKIAEINSTENSSTESVPNIAFAKRQDQTDTSGYSLDTENTSIANEINFGQLSTSNNGEDKNSSIQHAAAIAVKQKTTQPIAQKNQSSHQPSSTAQETPQVRIGQINVAVDNPSVNKSTRRTSTTTSSHRVNPFGLRGL